MGLFNDINFIFYKDIYVYLLALASYLCLLVIGVFQWSQFCLYHFKSYLIMQPGCHLMPVAEGHGREIIKHLPCVRPCTPLLIMFLHKP